MFTLTSISSALEFWSVNHTSIDENSELKVSKLSNNRPKNKNKCIQDSWIMLIIIVKKLKWTNATSAVSKWGTFSPLSF